MTIEQAISYVKPLDEASMKAAQKRFSDIAMPLGGLGILQEAIVRIAGMQRQPLPEIKPRAAVIFCADNGVVAEGVTQCGQDVTATVTRITLLVAASRGMPPSASMEGMTNMR